MPIIGTLPVTLTNGTVADANAVMQNFNYIAAQVNANVQTAIAAAVLAALPVGSIIDWSGSIGSIPAPWQLCDGTNGTPDLRDKFLVGAGSTYGVGDTGGATATTPTITVGNHTLALSEIPSHDHGFVDGGHTHTDSGHVHTSIDGQPNAVGASFGSANTLSGVGTVGVVVGAMTGISNANIQPATSNLTFNAQGGGQPHGHTGASSAVATLPPYYALAKIMKMS
jgi:hypothetical protein